MKPTFKKTLHPIVQLDDVIEITLNLVQTKLEDADGNLYKLLMLLDGTKEVYEIANQLQIPEQDIWEAIEALNELGYIENGEIPDTYTQTELERYQANLNYYSGVSNLQISKYSIQDKFKNSKVVVLGLGGGSLAASYLAGLGVGEIVGVDFDRVGRTNLNRQFLFNEDDIGRLKSEVAEEKIRKINPETRVKMYNRQIEKYDDLLDILEGANAVICMMDQPAVLSTRWVNAACIKLNIPYYRGGVNNQSILWERIIPQSSEPCYDCKLIDGIQKDPDNILRIKSNYGKTFSQVNTGFAPNLSLLTGLFISDITNLITGIAPLTKPIIDLNITTMSIEQLDNTIQKKSYCPTCSNEFIVMPSLDDLIDAAKQNEVLS